MLKLQKEAVAASTEAEVYEVAAHREDGLDVDLEKLLCISNKTERTRAYVQTHSQIPNAPNLTSNPQHASEHSSYVTRSYVAGLHSSLFLTKKEEFKVETVPMKQEHAVQCSLQNYHSKVKTEPFDGDDEVMHQSNLVRIQCKSDPLTQVPAGCSAPAPPHANYFTYISAEERNGEFRLVSIR